MSLKSYGFFIALLAYSLYTPLPEYFSEASTSAKLVQHILYTTRYVPAILELFGFGPAIQTARRFRELHALAQADASQFDVEWQDTQLDGVTVRMYRPKNATDVLPAIYYVRGGGFMVNNAVVYNELCSRLSSSLNAVVVSVQYRLAPEFGFPTAIEDCERALRCLATQAFRWNVDPQRIGIAGDSAGGNLAAALASRMRDTQQKLPYSLKFQFLIVPILQLHNFTTLSNQINPKDYSLYRDVVCILVYLTGAKIPASLLEADFSDYSQINRAILRNNHTLVSPNLLKRINEILDPQLYDTIYNDTDFQRLSSVPESRRITMSSESTKFSPRDEALSAFMEKFMFDPNVAPLMAPSLDGLPPAYLMAIENDFIRDDALLFAERLKASGVLAHVQRYNKYHAYAAVEPRIPVEDFVNFVRNHSLI